MLSAQKLKIDALSKEMVPGSRVSQDGRGSGEGRNDWCEVQGEAESKTMMILAVQLANKGEKWPPTKCWREFCKPGKITSQQYNWCKKPFFFFFLLYFLLYQGFSRWYSGKEPPCQYKSCQSHGFNPWVGKIPCKRKWQPTAVFLPGKSHRQRSLMGYSPQGHKESDTTEQLSIHTHYSKRC